MDTGHVKQVASFEKLLGFCNAQGAMFNPSKEALQPAALSALLTSAQQSIEAARTARIVWQQTLNVRNEAFEGLPKFLSRMVNVLAASGASRSTLNDAYAIVRKFRWSVAKRPQPPTAEGSEGIKPARTISQLDFDSKIENFEAMVKLVSLEPGYHPNEANLQGGALTAKAVELRALNTNVVNAFVALSNARASRNKLLYNDLGIHGTALAARRYVRGAFGSQSAAYGQIRSIQFVNSK